MKGKALGRVAPRKKLGDEIADTLRQAILTGQYVAGEKIGLEAVANYLDVSVMPVREALITLANEGLVELESRRGFRAKPLTQEDLDDVFEIQAHLTRILVQRAAQVATPEDIAYLRHNHELLVALADKPTTAANTRRAGELNSDFHRYIAKIPHGDRVRWFLRLTSRYVRDDLFESVPGILDAALAEHPKIIDALEQHDVERAGDLAEKHFAQGAHMVGCSIVPATA